MKRDRDGTFDATMGCYDDAEACKPVGAYILSRLTKPYNGKSLGLWRDNGLGVLQNISGPEADKIRKHCVQVFS